MTQMVSPTEYYVIYSVLSRTEMVGCHGSHLFQRNEFTYAFCDIPYQGLVDIITDDILSLIGVRRFSIVFSGVSY